MEYTTIFKYPLIPSSGLQLPQGAKILSVATQRNVPCIWAAVTPTNRIVTRILSVYGTGHRLPKDLGAYVGTFQMDNGNSVFHVFDNRETV